MFVICRNSPWRHTCRPFKTAATQVLCLFGPGMSKPRVKSEIRKQQYYIVTLPDCNHYFATCVIVTWQIQNLCHCTITALFFFVFEGNFQVQAPRCLYSEGPVNRGFLALQVWLSYIWRALYMDYGAFFFTILWYMEGCVSCWFSPLLREVFLQVLRFLPLLKNQHNLNSSSTRN